MTKKSYLKGGDRALGSMDDAFYWAESWFRKGGRIIGKQLGMTPKQIKRKNILLKTVKELESKAHFTHSPSQRHGRFLKEFQRPLLDVKKEKLKRVLKRYPKTS